MNNQNKSKNERKFHFKRQNTLWYLHRNEYEIQLIETRIYNVQVSWKLWILDEQSTCSRIELNREFHDIRLFIIHYYFKTNVLDTCSILRTMNYDTSRMIKGKEIGLLWLTEYQLKLNIDYIYTNIYCSSIVNVDCHWQSVNE